MDAFDPPSQLRGRGHPHEVQAEVLAVLEGRRGQAAALCTVIGRSGSAPQILGAKLLLHEDGTQFGTIGGGTIELRALEAAREAIAERRSRRIEAHLVRDLGMCCGGSMEVFVEYVESPARLFVIGAGHVAQALAPMAHGAGFAVRVLDDREELLALPCFVDAVAGAHDVDELLDDALPDLSEHDYLLIVTRDHERDERALRALVRRPHRLIGMIASRRKVHTVIGRILRREEELGRPPPDLGRVRSPVGLTLGGRTPGEVAVSIVAELVADRRGGGGARMSIVADAEAGFRARHREPTAEVEGDEAAADGTSSRGPSAA